MNQIESSKTPPEYFIILAIILVGALLRWIGLDNRPITHDESLHGVYGLYYYYYPDRLYYKYNPLLHGPFLYHIIPYIYKFLGISKWSIRFMPALIGTFFQFAPFLFRRYLSRSSLIGLTLLISLSPSLIYWSRYIRHDFYIIFFMLLGLYSLTLKKTSLRIGLFIFALIMQFTVKENAYIHLGLLIFYLVFEFVVETFYFKRNSPTYLKSVLADIRKHYYWYLLGLGLGVLSYCYFYSAEFRHLPGILDGLYRKSLVYWFEQHQIERIKGPFIYHWFNLAWYDYLFVLSILIYLVHHFFKNRKHWPVLVAAFILPLALQLIYQNDISNLKVQWIFFKLKTPMDFWAVFVPLIFGPYFFYYHQKLQDRKLAIASFAFYSFIFTYSYVGEKVPWLGLYPLITGLIYMALYWKGFEFTNTRNLYLKVTALSLIYLHTAVLTNFTQAGKKTEIIGQVHSTHEYEQALVQIQKKLDDPLIERKPTILNYSNNAWPLTWFFYDRPEFNFSTGRNHPGKFDYVFAAQYEPALEKTLAKTHRKKVLSFRGWWIPDFSKMTMNKFIRYLAFHEPWNPSGQHYISVFIKQRPEKVDK